MPKLKSNQFEIRPGVIITERPILFQREMVQANMEERKTQTRRTKGLDQKDSEYGTFKLEDVCHYWGDVDKTVASFRYYPAGEKSHNGSIDNAICPYGKPGDLLWVKETSHIVEDSATGEFIRYGYRADLDSTKYKNPNLVWSPSIHMPKAASRIWAMVEDIRVERVQDITEESAIAEGVKGLMVADNIFFYKSYSSTLKASFSNHWKKNIKDHDAAKKSFSTLWCSINGYESWNANPWVWVIQYRILSKTGRPSAEVIWENFQDVQYKISCPESYKGKEVGNG